MKKLAITCMSVSEIETLLEKKGNPQITLRLANILRLAKGESSRKSEELLLLSHNQICIWAKRFGSVTECMLI